MYDRVWQLFLSGPSPVLQDKETQLFAMTDLENSFPHFHILKFLFCLLLLLEIFHQYFYVFLIV